MNVLKTEGPSILIELISENEKKINNNLRPFLKISLLHGYIVNSFLLKIVVLGVCCLLFVCFISCAGLELVALILLLLSKCWDRRHVPHLKQYIR